MTEPIEWPPLPEVKRQDLQADVKKLLYQAQLDKIKMELQAGIDEDKATTTANLEREKAGWAIGQWCGRFCLYKKGHYARNVRCCHARTVEIVPTLLRKRGTDGHPGSNYIRLIDRDESTTSIVPTDRSTSTEFGDISIMICEIYTINPGGESKVKVTDNNTGGYTPSWGSS